MNRLNQRIVAAALIIVALIIAFLLLLNVFPPDEGGFGSMIRN